MRRPVAALLALLCISSCTTDLSSLQKDLTLVAQTQLRQTLATHFTRELGKGVGVVIDEIARPGGYLDNPLARILLPPPVGLIVDVTRELQADPEAALLSVLLNAAAEHAIPGAAPILQAAITQITPTEARALLEGGASAATERLRETTADELREALLPAVAESLGASGAYLVYNEMVAAYAARNDDRVEGDAVATERSDPAPEPPPEPGVELERYVAGQAVDGLFKVLGEREALIRESLDAATGGMLLNGATAPGEPAPAAQPR